MLSIYLVWFGFSITLNIRVKRHGISRNDLRLLSAPSLRFIHEISCSLIIFFRSFPFSLSRSFSLPISPTRSYSLAGSNIIMCILFGPTVSSMEASACSSLSYPLSSGMNDAIFIVFSSVRSRALRQEKKQRSTIHSI